MRLALYQPDIPQNTGTMMRLCACMGVPMDVIEPCGFVLSDKNLKRAGMDYLDRLDLSRHQSWHDFAAQMAGRRIVLLTTRAETRLPDFTFDESDIIMVGRESAGVPEDVHEAAGARVKIPMVAGTRSLNVAVTVAIALGEALRQTALFPAG